MVPGPSRHMLCPSAGGGFSHVLGAPLITTCGVATSWRELHESVESVNRKRATNVGRAGANRREDYGSKLTKRRTTLHQGRGPTWKD